MFFNNGMVWWKHAFRAPVIPSRTGRLHPNMEQKPQTRSLLSAFDSLFRALEGE
jgi:hypothetical protein